MANNDMRNLRARGATAQYGSWTRDAQPAYNIAQSGKDRVQRKINKAFRKHRRDAVKNSHQGSQTEMNAAYWAQIDAYLKKGLSLDEAKEKCRRRGIKRA